jgi:hypothetical protein
VQVSKIDSSRCCEVQQGIDNNDLRRLDHKCGNGNGNVDDSDNTTTSQLTGATGMSSSEDDGAL